MSKWTLFSNHGHVLVVLSRDPDARLRDVAQVVGITERAVQKIVRDLQDGGLLSVTKRGRRNRYRLHRNQPLRHTLEAHCSTGELLDMVNRRAPGLEPVESPEAPAAAPAPPVPPAVEAAVPATAEPGPPEPAAHERDGRPESTRGTGERSRISPPDDSEQGSLF
jgi:hypothetical protein